MVNIKRFFLKNKALLLLILLALSLRLPWLYTTIERDEGIFGYSAWSMLSRYESYNEIGDAKPPLLYILYAIPIYFFGNSIIPIRILNNILFILYIIFFFKLAGYSFSRRIAFFSTLFYVIFMNIPVFEGYLAMSESLLTPFLIISVYLFKKYVMLKKGYYILGSSAFAIATIMIKQQSIFIYPLLISGVFIYKEKCKMKKIFYIISPLLLIGLIILSIDAVLILNLLRKTWYGINQPYTGFVSGYRSFTYNQLIFLEGSLLWLFSIIGLIKVLKSKFKEDTLFILSWLVFAFIFTIIPPAYGHYYIFLIPPLGIFSGIGMSCILESKQDKKIFFLLVMILIILTGRLMINSDSKLNLGFDWRVSSLENYNKQILLSEYIKNITLPEDKVSVWGWEPQLYWLSERHSFSQYPGVTCERFLLRSGNLTAEQLDETVYQKGAKAIVLIPGYERRCENMTREVFSNPPPDYYETEFNGVKILYKKVR